MKRVRGTFVLALGSWVAAAGCGGSGGGGSRTVTTLVPSGASSSGATAAGAPAAPIAPVTVTAPAPSAPAAGAPSFSSSSSGGTSAPKTSPAPAPTPGTKSGNGGAGSPSPAASPPPVASNPSGTTGGATDAGALGSAAPAPTGLPSSARWMSEDREVQWLASLGFTVTVAELRASYASFVPQPVDPNTNVLWGTETDPLRNFFRLYRRTGHAGFLTQAQSWRDYFVNVYSNWQAGGHNVVEPEHVYLMGLIDWWDVHRDAATLAAIDRILDFIEQKVTSNPFFETRVSARCIQCLAYYLEKIGTRRSDVLPKLQDFVAGVKAAPQRSGLVCMKFAVGTNIPVSFLPPGLDLTKQFPGDAAQGIVVGPDAFDLKGFLGAGVYQDCMLIHALGVAGRVLGDSSLDGLAAQIARAWEPHVVPPFWDPEGKTWNRLVPYYFLPEARETDLFHQPDASSTPLYVTQFAAHASAPAVRRELAVQALLRQYGENSKIQPAEVSGKPRYLPWQTFENGYFLLQE